MTRMPKEEELHGPNVCFYAHLLAEHTSEKCIWNCYLWLFKESVIKK